MSEERNRKTRERRDLQVRILQDYKEKQGCADCGQTFPHYVLQFDHLPGTEKLGSPGNLVRRFGWEKVKAEVSPSQIILKDELNKIGKFKIDINFHSEVKAFAFIKIDKIQSK